MSTSNEESDSKIGYTICAIIFIIVIFLFEILIAFGMFKVTKTNDNLMMGFGGEKITDDIQQNSVKRNEKIVSYFKTCFSQTCYQFVILGRK